MGDEAPIGSRKGRSADARQRAIRALSSGATNRQAARHAAVDEKTIRRWMTQPAFAKEVEELLEQQRVQAERRLRGAASRVANFLVLVATGRRGGKAAAAQVTAARDVLERLHVGKAARVQASDPLAEMSDEELVAVVEKATGKGGR